MKEAKRHDGKKWMPAMYVAYFGIIEKLANQHGYALCIHGSVVRDFDIIAVPFDFKVKPHADLLSAIKKVVGIGVSSDKIFDIIGNEPHGRTCYTIECGGGGFFDISFTPTMQEAIALVKRDQAREKEIKKLFKVEPK